MTRPYGGSTLRNGPVVRGGQSSWSRGSVFLSATGGPLHRPGSPSASLPCCASLRRACWPAVAVAAPGTRSRPPGARAGARPRTRGGNDPAHADALLGHGHDDPGAPVDDRAEHAGDVHGDRHGRVDRKRRRGNSREGRAGEGAQSGGPPSQGTTRGRPPRGGTTRERTPRGRPAGKGASGTDPSAIARLTGLVPNTSTKDLSSTALLLAAAGLVALLCASGSFVSVQSRISRGQLR